MTPPVALLDTPTGSYPLQATLVGPTIERMPDDPDGQVAAAIGRMSQYVCQDYLTAPIQYDAQQAVALASDNPLGAVHHLVRSRVRFAQDEQTAQPYQWLLKKPGTGPNDDAFVEAFTRPVDLSIKYAGTGQPVDGDCDDFSMYCAALLKALNIDCCFATVAADEQHPNEYSHVYVVAYFNGKRVAMDCSHGPYAGWECTANRKITRYNEWPIVDRANWANVGIGLLLVGWLAWKYRKELREVFA